MARGGTTLRADLRAVSVDGAAFSVMVGAGEAFFPAFVLALGMSEVAAGLVATVPLLAGAVIQMASPPFVRRFGSNRRWVVLTAALQGATFVPLIVAALVGAMPPVLLFGVVALYWGFGFASGPAWTTWVGTLVPHRIFARFFALRTRLAQAALLASLLLAGLALEGASRLGSALPMFALLFLVAAASRFVSVRVLTTQSEPEPQPPGLRDVPFLEMLRRLLSGSDGRVLLVVLAVQAAVQVAQPFVNPYLLGQVGLPYREYALLVAMPFLARIVALPALGRVAQRHGALRVLWIAAIALVPAALLWTVSSSFAWMLAVQALTGFAMAAYELSAFLLYFETLPRAERTSALTTLNLLNAVAIVGGSVVGAQLLQSGAATRGAYLTIFAVSAIVRFLAIPLLATIRPRRAASDPASDPASDARASILPT